VGEVGEGEEDKREERIKWFLFNTVPTVMWHVDRQRIKEILLAA